MPDRTWGLILHGGAKEIPEEKARAHREGCRVALDLGCAILRDGGTALDAVEIAVRCLEDDPTFNAGFGSALNRDGQVEMDAGIMEGADLNVGSVAALEGIPNPVSVARRLLHEEPILLVGAGARQFALAQGLPTCAPESLISAQHSHSRGPNSDTVGCVALDLFGNMAAATSTGGLPGKQPGRVGDSPLAGAGYYVENALGGVSMSGDGESIGRVLLAGWVMRHLERDGPQAAMDLALLRLRRVGGEAGGIVLSQTGETGWAHNSSHFAVAYRTSRADRAHVYLRKAEEPS
jgi:beta-aspartyl-peptidase (threonine type)